MSDTTANCTISIPTSTDPSAGGVQIGWYPTALVIITVPPL